MTLPPRTRWESHRIPLGLPMSGRTVASTLPPMVSEPKGLVSDAAFRPTRATTCGACRLKRRGAVRNPLLRGAFPSGSVAVNIALTADCPRVHRLRRCPISALLWGLFWNL